MGPSHEQLMALWNLCTGFVNEHEISCPETIYQVDSVNLACPEFVSEVCECVGFYQEEKSPEIEDDNE